MSTIEEAIRRKKLADSKTSHNSKNNADSVLTVTENVAAPVEVMVNNVNEGPQNDNKNNIFLDAETLESKHFLALDSNASNNDLNKEQHLLTEEFRQIKRKLLNNAYGAIAKTLQNPNLVMITSSQANEGKTFISINLALSIALEQDKTVLLVDADVLKPSIPKELGFKHKKGLIDYLYGNVDSLSDIIYNTNIQNLKILPAGRKHHLSNEFLASEKMASLCKELQQRYTDRMIIFDCPPLLGINETSVLAQLMGQALIVVEENKSSIQEIQKANELLPDSLAKGLVLNKAIHSQKEAYGYYGYGYGYGKRKS